MDWIIQQYTAKSSPLVTIFAWDRQLDIFGKKLFQGEIIWEKTNGQNVGN